MRLAATWRGPRGPLPRRTPRTLPIALLAALAALWIGLMAALGSWLVLGGLVILAAASSLLWAGTREPSQPALRALTVLGALLMLSSGFFQHVLRLPIGYLLELVLFSMLLGTMLHARRYLSGDRALRLVMLLFVFYLSLAVLSSVAGRSTWIAALWQFQYNIKWAGMFLLGTMIVWDPGHERLLRGMLLVAWVPMLAMVGVEWAMPSLHATILQVPIDGQINPLLGALHRFKGPFQHSGYLALLSAALAWCCIVAAVSQRRWCWLVPALIYATLLVLSGQRQEAAGLTLAVLALAGWLGRRHLSVIVVAAVLLLAAAGAVLLWADGLPTPAIVAQWGGGDPLHPLSERAILSTKGLEVGNRYFPLGAGLGTYGGAGAQKFDQSLFLDLGFGRFWWFREGKFLVDVYWPSVVAEAGWIGAASLLACYGTIFGTLLVRARRAGGRDPLLLVAAGCLLILLSNTPSSAIITDPRGSFVLWLLIGAAWRRSRAESLPAAPAGQAGEPKPAAARPRQR
jgi:hypothetical protein